eukprot:CAMPEP_0176503938 /NCGR_PEP_ID=MMETSP0200_2-20121128/15655_1 /TAXON_ID=947934 /ORGANISM="Chaetoceros sp., Strain GSL56" /LENGTH=949 /DNA_ID=CAMNT_0017903313 /DNA_START=423 /DNA_END=3269 /DNA_ORIENTATION=-
MSSSFEIKLDEQDSEKLKQCLTDIIKYESQICCRNALKMLEFEICPRLNDDAIFYVLTNTSIVVDESKMNNNRALDDFLLSYISSDDFAEICRERACTCLKTLLGRLRFDDKEDDDGMTRRSGNAVLLGYAQSSLNKFIPICVNRLSSTMPTSSTIMPSGGCTPVERSEEIRLLLIQIVLQLVQLLGSEMTRPVATSEELETVVSKLCLELPRSSLLDPYPELKQESCNLIKILCQVFPQCVQKHAETLLTPLVGRTITKVNGEKGVVESNSSDASLAIEKDFASSLQMSTSVNTLLRHRHSKIRCIALETVAVVLTCTCEVHDDLDGAVDRILFQVLPNVEPLGPFDKSTSVRIKLSQMVCSHLGLLLEGLMDNGAETPLKVKYTVAGLLILHLMCVSDASEIVQETAQKNSRELVSTYHLGYNGISKLIRQHANSILHTLLDRIVHGRAVEHKKRYLDAFSSMLKHLTMSSALVDGFELPKCFHVEMKSIVSMLCDAFNSEEKCMYESAIHAAASMGFNLESRKSALGIILASIGSPNEIKKDISPIIVIDEKDESKLILSSPRHFSTMLCVISSLLRGMLDSTNIDHEDTLIGVMKISSSAAREKIIEAIYESEDTAFSLLDVLNVVTLWCKKYMTLNNEHSLSSIDIIFQTNLFCCMHLLGGKHSLRLATSTRNLIALTCTSDLRPDAVSPPDLLDPTYNNKLEKYFPDILSMIVHDLKIKDGHETWTYGNPGMFAFDAFLRVNDATCVSKYFHLVVPVFIAHLSDGSQCQGEKDEDYLQKKLFFMALLETLFSSVSESKSDQMNEFTERLVFNAILPNLIWQSGGLASSLRKVSVAVLYSILRSVGITRVMLHKFAPSLFPTLRSTLHDDDETTRELVTAIFAKMFASNSLGKEAVYQLYPDLMRGLDDSDHRVRFASCEAIIAFLGSSPLDSFEGEILENIVE